MSYEQGRQIGYAKPRIARFHSVAIIFCLCVSLASAASAAGQASPAAAHCEQNADAEDIMPFVNKPPTLFKLMGSRYEQASGTVRGYRCSGVVLVAFDGQHWWPAGKSDDIGLYYFVAEISRFIRVDVNVGIDIFLALLLTICFASGVAGMFFWLNFPLSRIVGLVGLTALAIVTAWEGDV
jgi:hypothetical protein